MQETLRKKRGSNALEFTGVFIASDGASEWRFLRVRRTGGSDCHRWSCSVDMHWWCHSQAELPLCRAARNHMVMNVKLKKLKLTRMLFPPVFVQIASQLADCFWEAHFHHIGEIPILWFQLESDDSLGRFVRADLLCPEGILWKWRIKTGIFFCLSAARCFCCCCCCCCRRT